MHYVVCLFTPQLSPVFVALISGRMARLSWPRWLMVTHPSTNRAKCRLTALLDINALLLSHATTTVGTETWPVKHLS